MWSKNELVKLVKEKLSDYLLVIVSNRQPYVHVMKEGKIECLKPAGGVVTALDPVVKACNGTWVAYGNGNADKKMVDKHNKIQVPPEKPAYTLRRIWLTKEEEDGYYFGFSNEALWPLCHIAYTRPIFSGPDWECYKKVNQIFADAVLEEVKGKKALVWIQDYHMALLPKMLKEKRPDLMVVHFWHIPWPNPEAFRICPNKKEILEGLLANDLLGFHIRYYCDNFLSTIDREIEARIDRERTSVVCEGHESLVRAFPISVDFEGVSNLANSEEVKKKIKQLKDEYLLHYEHVVFGLDRIDYTKGIIERLRALDRFLEKYPQYREKFVFIQMGALSRIHIPKYKLLNDEINSLVEDINWKYSTDFWSPIIMVRRTLTPVELTAFCRLANVCLVSSIHDGMNIVCKEYISSQVDLDGVLILSQFTGAARELVDAVSVNPYDIETFADKIKESFEMPRRERSKRMRRLRKVVAENNIYKWAGKLIQELEKIRAEEKTT